MQAIEWWPTESDKSGIQRAYVWISGPCGECGINVTRRTIPYEGNSTEACSKKCRRAITKREREAGTLRPEERPKPWSQPEEFDLWLAYGFDAVNAYRSARTRQRLAQESGDNAPVKVKVGREDGMREQALVIGRGVAKRIAEGDQADAERLLLTLPVEYRARALDCAAGSLPKFKRDVAARKFQPPQSPKPVKPLITQKQIAEYQVWRVAVSKSPHPIVSEYRRRLMCPRPDKVAYEDTELGWAAAKWHADDLKRDEWGKIVSAYKCGGCHALHVGHDWNGNYNKEEATA